MQRLGDFRMPPSSTTRLTSRSLSHEAKEVFLAALVNEGRAEWMDKGHKKCLILWLRIQDWATLIINFVKDNGLEVMTIEEIRSGIDTRGTGFVRFRTWNHIEPVLVSAATGGGDGWGRSMPRQSCSGWPQQQRRQEQQEPRVLLLGLLAQAVGRR